MCIIAIKPENKIIFSDTMLENMFSNNPDGAGYMYPQNGKVIIKKGFMTLKALKESLAQLEKQVDVAKTPIILHARITTHGDTSKGNCHPFPISGSFRELQATRITTNLGMAHNGVINIVPKSNKYSDTQQYIFERLNPLKKEVPNFLQCDTIKQFITDGIGGSKLAFLDGTGKITTIGNFISSGGYLFSNSSYEYSWLTDFGYFSSKTGGYSSKSKKHKKYYNTYSSWWDYAENDDKGNPYQDDPYSDFETLMVLDDNSIIEDETTVEIYVQASELYAIDAYGYLFKKVNGVYTFYSNARVMDNNGDDIVFDYKRAKKYNVMWK